MGFAYFIRQLNSHCLIINNHNLFVSHQYFTITANRIGEDWYTYLRKFRNKLLNGSFKKKLTKSTKSSKWTRQGINGLQVWAIYYILLEIHRLSLYTHTGSSNDDLYSIVMLYLKITMWYAASQILSFVAGNNKTKASGLLPARQCWNQPASR